MAPLVNRRVGLCEFDKPGEESVLHSGLRTTMGIVREVPIA